MNHKHAPNARFREQTETEPESDMFTVLLDGQIPWRTVNANLIAFGAWLAIGVLILCSIGEMQGW